MAGTLKVVFMVCTASVLGHDVVNIGAHCPSTTAHVRARVNRVTFLTNLAEGVTSQDEEPELLPLPTVATLTSVATVSVKLARLQMG